MKFIKIVSLLVLFTLLNNCAGAKVKKLLSQGAIQQQHFKQTFPFKYTETGHILVKVTIKGKVYDFILDTGATTIISKELAETLNVKPIGSSVIADINDNEATLNYVKLENVEIGGVNFNNTIGSILDLRKGELACLEVDGLVGANLMRHAVWDFDFKHQTITITDDESKLNIPTSHSDSKIFIGDAYQVSLITKVNETRVLNCLVDLGNSSHSMLSYKVFKELKEAEKITDFVKGTGGSGFGAFGRTSEKRTSYHTKINAIQIGNINIENEIMRIEDNNINLGLSLFKNYRVIFNWKTRSFKMIKQQEKEGNSTLKTFGFTPMPENNKLYVDYLYANTKAAKSLKFKDQILSINGKDYSFFSEQDWCKVMQNKQLLIGKYDKIKIKVLRNGEELEFELEKVKLL